MTIEFDDAVPASFSSIVTAAEVYGELGIATPTEVEASVVQTQLIKVVGSVREYIRYDPTLATRIEYHPQQPFQAQISRGIWEVMEQRAVLRQVSEAATNELQLQCLPVRSVVEVRVDYDGRSGSRTGSFPTSSIKRQGQDYWANRDVIDGSGNPVCRDGVLRTIGLWPTTPGTVKVEYTAGYSDAEFRGEDGVVDASPIWASILDETCRRVRYVLGMKKGTRGLPMGVMSNESLGEYSYSMDAESVKRLQSGTLLPDTVNRLSSFVNWGWSLGS